MNIMNENRDSNYACLLSQDAIDFFLGKYVIKDGEGAIIPCPLVTQKGWKHATVRVFLKKQFSGWISFDIYNFYLSIHSSHLFCYLPSPCSLPRLLFHMSTTPRTCCICCFGAPWSVSPLRVFSVTEMNSSIFPNFFH